MVSRAIPRIDYVEQSIAISGFTDDGVESGHIDLDDLIPDLAIVLGWIGSITTRFTGGTGGAVRLSVGTPDAPEAFGLRRMVTQGQGSAQGDVPQPGQAIADLSAERRVRVTVWDEFDFGAVTGGALTVKVLFVRTEA